MGWSRRSLWGEGRIVGFFLFFFLGYLGETELIDTYVALPFYMTVCECSRFG